jgi:hypothetical protein
MGGDRTEIGDDPSIRTVTDPLPESGNEVMPAVLPPPRSPLIPLHSPHLFQHPLEVDISGLDSTAHEGPTTFHGTIEVFEQPLAAGLLETVRIGKQTKSRWAVGESPAETFRASLVIDWHTHSGQRREVVRRSAWRGKVKVEKCDGFTVSEDNVLETNIIMAND